MKISREIGTHFSEVLTMIHQARYDAIKSANAELIKLYWRIGEYISKKLETAEWGDVVVEQLADYIQNKNPEFKGFTRRNLYRMRQLYETYQQKRFVSSVLTQISWTNHLLILSKTKTKEEREFYLALTIKERYSSRELGRQIDSGYYERVMLSRKKMVSSALTQIHPDPATVFKDTYILDFLALPKEYLERDLRKSIVTNLRDFILEFGTTAVENNLKKLKSKGAIARVGSARGGIWRING